MGLGALIRQDRSASVRRNLWEVATRCLRRGLNECGETFNNSTIENGRYIACMDILSDRDRTSNKEIWRLRVSEGLLSTGDISSLIPIHFVYYVPTDIQP